ncbi:hypothetical protein AAKU61_004587 [Undibacterium sp. GrIS 1.2]|uniref:DUF1173 family protein n=1 Tax=Undibacterium sp. GrIS 1.2 TaxID=3143933 RepID=UPI00339211E8
MSQAFTFFVDIGGTQFSQSSGNRLQEALQIAHRQGRSFCLCCTGKQIPLVVKRYNKDNVVPHYGLARWPETGLDHDADCYFFGEDTESQESSTNLPAFEELANGQSRAYLSIALNIIERNMQAIALKKTQPPAPGNKRDRANEVTLLLKLWRLAGLNIYRGQDRRWYQATFNLLKAAKQIVINKEGETLDQYLLVGSANGDKLAFEHNHHVLDHAKKKYTRLFVIGRLKAYGRDKSRQMLQFKDFHGLPRIAVKLDQLDAFLQDKPFYQELLNKEEGHIIAIACIEPSTKEWWSVLHLNGISTSTQMVPVEKSEELLFEAYLSSLKRKFIKPLAHDGSTQYLQRSEFILLDTPTRTYCEVFDFTALPATSDLAERSSKHRSKGQDYLTWINAPGAAYPALPASNKIGLSET